MCRPALDRCEIEVLVRKKEDCDKTVKRDGVSKLIVDERLAETGKTDSAEEVSAAGLAWCCGREQAKSHVEKTQVCT